MEKVELKEMIKKEEAELSCLKHEVLELSKILDNETVFIKSKSIYRDPGKAEILLKDLNEKMTKRLRLEDHIKNLQKQLNPE